MSKHTPGPWRVDIPLNKGQHGIAATDPKDDMLFCVADIYGVDSDSSKDAPVATANARLIAAAPDLLDALEKVTIAAENIGGEHVTGLRQLNDQLEVAYAAIAKATGGKE